jgi:predicted transposase
MITLKIPYRSSKEFQDFLKELRREYSCLVRYSYNRLKEGVSEKDIRVLHKVIYVFKFLILDELRRNSRK